MRIWSIDGFRRYRGFSLLEVLIALLIFSLGLLGMAGLMVVSVKTNQSAYLRTQASFLAQSMVDRIRMNLGQVNDYNGEYGEDTVEDAGCGAAEPCSPEEIAERDKAIWSQQLVDSLPNATASIDCDGESLGNSAQLGAAPYSGLCTFTIQWDETSLTRSATSSPNEQTFAWVFQP
jgi:type IV pilus assembly protein PilV